MFIPGASRTSLPRSFISAAKTEYIFSTSSVSNVDAKSVPIGKSDALARRSVGCANCVNALVAECAEHAAVCAGVADGTKRRIHFVVASCDCLKFAYIKLCHKFVERFFAVFDIGECNSPVARLRNRLGQIV